LQSKNVKKQSGRTSENRDILVKKKTKVRTVGGRGPKNVCAMQTWGGRIRVKRTTKQKIGRGGAAFKKKKKDGTKTAPFGENIALRKKEDRRGPKV